MGVRMQMIIKKIFNNNAIVVKDADKYEFVVMGCGIAFKKSVGDRVDENLIEKTFILKQKDASEKLKLLLEHVPVEYVLLCYDIVEYAKNMLEVQLSDYIYVTLTDHINNAIKMFDEGFRIINPIIWEIKKLYYKEYEVGLKALEFIKNEIGKELPEDEAANIALYIINAQLDRSCIHVDDAAMQAKKIQDILNIIKYTYNNTFDEQSIHYQRFVTHLRFFFQRFNCKTKTMEDDFLLKQVKEKYKIAYDCMLKIEEYLETELSDEEKLYLTIHIQRMTQK